MFESISKNNELENEMTLDMSYFWYSDVCESLFNLKQIFRGIFPHFPFCYGKSEGVSLSLKLCTFLFKVKIMEKLKLMLFGINYGEMKSDLTSFIFKISWFVVKSPHNPQCATWSSGWTKDLNHFFKKNSSFSWFFIHILG